MGPRSEVRVTVSDVRFTPMNRHHRAGPWGSI